MIIDDVVLLVVVVLVPGTTGMYGIIRRRLNPVLQETVRPKVLYSCRSHFRTCLPLGACCMAMLLVAFIIYHCRSVAPEITDE